MKKTGLLGDLSDQLDTLAKQTGKAIAKSPTAMVKTAASQIGGATESEEEKAKKAQQVEGAGSTGVQQTEETKKVVDFLYGKGQEEVGKEHFARPQRLASKDLHGGRGIRDQLGISELTKGQEKTPEEQQKLAQLRNTLHQEYYQKLVNPQKKQEERQAEKVEREEKKEEQKKLVLEEKKKKKPIAVHRAANRVEKFRGVSG